LPYLCALVQKAMKQAFAEDGLDLGKLKNGIHRMDWVLNATFFQAFEGSLIQEGEMNVVLDLERIENVFSALLSINGKAKVLCDSCLEEIHLPFQNKLKFVVKLTGAYTEDDLDNEVFYVMENNPRFYLSQHIYDMVNLGLPIRKTCEDPGNMEACNLEVLNKLNDSGSAEEEGNDPRWDKLKDLLN
jgi:uncharacterized metal-binding protein YceD (DUF177 family)